MPTHATTQIMRTLLVRTSLLLHSKYLAHRFNLLWVNMYLQRSVYGVKADRQVKNVISLCQKLEIIGCIEKGEKPYVKQAAICQHLSLLPKRLQKA